jgi:hypothetical protein
MKKIIKFSKIKKDIIKSLNKKLNEKKLHINEKITLLDGFVNQVHLPNLQKEWIIGGNSIPMIILVGDESGQIYYFALKAILPKLNLNN